MANRPILKMECSNAESDAAEENLTLLPAQWHELPILGMKIRKGKICYNYRSDSDQARERKSKGKSKVRVDLINLSIPI